jgi:hypothetical protein
MSLRALLAVSTCVSATALMRWSRSAASAAATRSGSAGAARPKSSTSTSIPMPCIDSAQPMPKRPWPAPAPVAAREEVGIRRLPAAVAVGDIERDMMPGARHRLQVRPQRLDHVDSLPS